MSRQFRRQLKQRIEKLFRRSKKRHRSRGNQFDFARMEPKQLLAVASTALPANLNLVENGEFETAIQDTWTGQGNVTFSDTPNSGTVAHLDGAENGVGRLSQDVETVGGNDYVVTFEYRSNNASGDTDSNTIQVLWNELVVETVVAQSLWDVATIRVTAEAATTELMFRELEAGDDGLGPIIDNVRVTAVQNQHVANFSFENVTENSSFSVPTGERFTAPFSNVNVWKAGGDDASSRQIQIVQDSNAKFGSRYLNLETTSTNVDRVYQDIVTEAGQYYFVTFELRGDTSVDAASNEVRVRFGDNWVGTFVGGEDWQTVGMLVEADSASSRLVFREVTGGDGTGPFIDRIKFEQVIVQNTSDAPVNDLEVDIDPSTAGRGGTASFNEGAGPTEIVTDGIDISHNSGTTLSFATARIEDIQDGANEVLSVSPGDTGLTSSYDPETGRLRIFGTASISDYESVLETLSYDNTSANPTGTSRSISISVSDDTIVDTTDFSARSFIDLTISESNAAPVIQNVADRTINFGENLSLQVQASDVDDSQLSYELQTEGNTGAVRPSINSDGLITWDSAYIPNGDVTFEVTVEDGRGGSATEEFSVTVDGFDPFSGNGQLANIDPEFRNGIYESAPELTIDTSLNYEAVLDTTAGEIRLELFADQTPITVNNFVNLAEDGYYDGVNFHRVIAGFVAQGGDPLGTGTGGPGYTFEDEIVSGLEFNGFGQLAMANSGPATNGSQFFITYAAQPHLTGNHTIFGNLTAGTEALNAIAVTGQQSVPTVINSIQIITTDPNA